MVQLQKDIGAQIAVQLRQTLHFTYLTVKLGCFCRKTKGLATVVVSVKDINNIENRGNRVFI